MSEDQAVEFIDDEGSVIRACDFGPTVEPENRYLTFPDLEPMQPIGRDGLYFIPSQNILVRLRDPATRNAS